MELKILLWVHIVGELPSDARRLPHRPCVYIPYIYVHMRIHVHTSHAESPSLHLTMVTAIVDGMHAPRNILPASVLRHDSRVLPLCDVLPLA